MELQHNFYLEWVFKCRLVAYTILNDATNVSRPMDTLEHLRVTRVKKTLKELDFWGKHTWEIKFQFLKCKPRV